MKSKFGFIIGIGIGFVLGARAGRERYEQIRSVATRVRNVPVISRPLDAAGEKVADSVRHKGEEIADAVAEAVKEKLFGINEVREHED